MTLDSLFHILSVYRHRSILVSTSRDYIYFLPLAIKSLAVDFRLHFTFFNTIFVNFHTAISI